MQLKNSTTRFGIIAQLLHWAIVALIIGQFYLALKGDALPLGMAKLAVLAQHKSFGITVLMLAVIRLVWRFVNPVPEEDPAMPAWQRIAARTSHIALYALIFVVPVVGWLMSSAKAYSVSWFGLVTLPDFIGQSDGAFAFLRELHEILAYTLAAVAIVHALAALQHHFIERSNVLRRMLPVKLKPDQNR
jgi:cytochrome b561